MQIPHIAGQAFSSLVSILILRAITGDAFYLGNDTTWYTQVTDLTQCFESYSEKQCEYYDVADTTSLRFEFQLQESFHFINMKSNIRGHFIFSLNIFEEVVKNYNKMDDTINDLVL